MAATPHVDERGRQAATESTGGEGHCHRGQARAVLVTGLAWAGVVVLSWLAWWGLGDGGREALARTVGLSAAQLAPFVVATLIAEKLAAKTLLLAALYHWLRGRQG